MGENTKESVLSPDDSTYKKIINCNKALQKIMDGLVRQDQNYNEQQLSDGLIELEKLLGQYNGETGYDGMFDRVAKEFFTKAQKFLKELKETREE